MGTSGEWRGIKMTNDINDLESYVKVKDPPNFAFWHYEIIEKSQPMIKEVFEWNQ
jgi:hypothetical protein